MTYTIHIGERDRTGWLPEVAREQTRAAASARARELLAVSPFFGAEVRCQRRLVESYVKRHPDDLGLGLPRGRRLYFNGIRRVFVDPARHPAGDRIHAPGAAGAAGATGSTALRVPDETTG